MSFKVKVSDNNGLIRTNREQTAGRACGKGYFFVTGNGYTNAGYVKEGINTISFLWANAKAVDNIYGIVLVVPTCSDDIYRLIPSGFIVYSQWGNSNRTGRCFITIYGGNRYCCRPLVNVLYCGDRSQFTKSQ